MEKLHQDYEHIKDWWFYDLQNILERYSLMIEKRNEEEKKQAKSQGYDTENMNTQSMMNMAKGMMPKTPNMNVKFPTL